MLKKIICMLVITLGICGCSAKSTETQTDIAETTASTVTEADESQTEETEMSEKTAGFMLIGHSTLEIITGDGKVICVDPYQNVDFPDKADIILVTHGHSDHNAVSAIEQNDGAEVITYKEMLVDGEYKSVTRGDVKITAVPAYNKNHDKNFCVGYVIETDGKVIYHSGDTDKIDEMAELEAYNIDYAFLPTDGQYNMGIDEAIGCAELIKAQNYVPMHTKFPEGTYNEEAFDAFADAFGKSVMQGEFVSF